MNAVVKYLLVWAALGGAPVLAQYQPGAGEAPSTSTALPPQMLSTLEAAVPMTPQLRAVRDALASIWKNKADGSFHNFDGKTIEKRSRYPEYLPDCSVSPI